MDKFKDNYNKGFKKYVHVLLESLEQIRRTHHLTANICVVAALLGLRHIFIFGLNCSTLKFNKKLEQISVLS